VESFLDFQQGHIIFSTLKASKQALGSIRPPFQCVLEALSAGTKRSGRKPNHSSPSSAVLKNT
jgi:hypothetical protein